MTELSSRTTGHSARSNASGRKLTAALFVQPSSLLSDLIEAWLQDGHRISTIVFYRQKWPTFWSSPVQWLDTQLTLLRLLRRNSIRIVNLLSPDWTLLQENLAKEQADVGICFGFPRLIPATVRSLFPHGVLNFHPALLPHYRGPLPLHWLALDNAWQEYGGMTLHEMTDAFDQGAIIAQAAMSDADIADLGKFMGASLCTMTRRVVPRYCSGEVAATVQPTGTYRYAGRAIPSAVVQPNWTRNQLKLVNRVFGKRPGVYIEADGKTIRLSARLRDFGPPTGAAPEVRLTTVAFDLADGRVECNRYTRLTKLANRLNRLRSSRHSTFTEVPIQLNSLTGSAKNEHESQNV